MKISSFVDGIIELMGMHCYLAITPNDQGYDIEVEADEGSIAGVYATNTDDLAEARKVAQDIDNEIRGRNIRVFQTRKEWERFLGQ